MYTATIGRARGANGFVLFRARTGGNRVMRFVSKPFGNSRAETLRRREEKEEKSKEGRRKEEGRKKEEERRRKKEEGSKKRCGSFFVPNSASLRLCARRILVL